jgi:hypothetical protein
MTVPQPFDVEAMNTEQEFRLWMAQFEDYVSLAAPTFSNAQKAKLLLHCAGLSVRRIVDGLNVDADAADP